MVLAEGRVVRDQGFRARCRGRAGTRRKGLGVRAAKPGLKPCQPWETRLPLGVPEPAGGAGGCWSAVGAPGWPRGSAQRLGAAERQSGCYELR